MARSYSLEISTKRRVALDAHFQCPNPACGFQAPVRAFGDGGASRTIRSTPGMWTNAQRIDTIPTVLKLEMKKEAERNAWHFAQQRLARVACPRCRGGSDPLVVFGGGAA